MIGERLGPYRVTRELGAGGMGRVFEGVVDGKAPGLADGVVVALKVLHPHLLDTPGFFKRFLREAEIGRRIVHENVVRTLDCDQVVVDGQVMSLLVMEYVEGQTLRGLLEQLGRLPEELCRHVGREIAKGLAAIHAAGVVHRDVKPENVLITREHVVKVMDLGVARPSDEVLRLSKTGDFVGSLLYAAPEQFQTGGSDVDARADLHALGVVLYELATAVHPYRGHDVAAMVWMILEAPPRRCGELNPQLSAFYEEVVHTLLAKRPADRFASAGDVLRVLEEGERSAWWHARAKTIRASTRRPLRRIRVPRETALYGREAEIARLRGLYEKAKAGDGQVVVIEGEAGIGKSRLVDEFVALLQREGDDVNFLHGSFPPAGAATASGAFRTAYAEQFGVESLDETLVGYLGESRALAPAFAALLRGASAPDGTVPLSKDAVQTCFVRATWGLAAERATVVLIDDLHFAPDEGRALFAALAVAVPGRRVLLVGTSRGERDETWIAHLDRLGATRVALARLGARDLARLLVDALGSERLADELGFRILAKSDGNPFFVFEILRTLREGRLLTQRADGSWASTSVIAELTIPSTIVELVGARLCELDPDDRELLDVAACAGFEFDPALVAGAVGMPVLLALKRFAGIERRHRLVRAAGRNLRFDHHQVQEALHGALYERTREAYHAALAEAIEARAAVSTKDVGSLDRGLCTDLAEHYSRGARWPEALRYLDAALSHLERGYRNEAVIALADRVLDAPGVLEGVRRAEVLLRKAARLSLLGRRDAERSALDEALALADAGAGAGLRARVRQSLGELFWRTSRNAEAQASLDEARALFQAAGDRAGEAAVVGTLGIVSLNLGRLPEARARFEQRMELSRAVGDRVGEVGATINLGVVLQELGFATEAHASFERGRALAASIGHRHFEATATGNLGLQLLESERYAEAKVLFERHLALAREIGERQGEATATGNLGMALEALGRLAEARDHHEWYLELSRQIGYRKGESIAERHLGGALRKLGRLEEAEPHAVRALAIAQAIGDRLNEGHALVALATLRTERGDVAAADRLFVEASTIRRALGHVEGATDGLMAWADLLVREGRFEEARGALEEALRTAEHRALSEPEVLARAHLARLPAEDARPAIGRAVAALVRHQGRIGVAVEMEARFRLSQAASDPTELVAARRLLDEALALVAPEYRDSMRANVRLNREIAEATAALGT